MMNRRRNRDRKPTVHLVRLRRISKGLSRHDALDMICSLADDRIVLFKRVYSYWHTSTCRYIVAQELKDNESCAYAEVLLVREDEIERDPLRKTTKFSALADG